MSINIGSNLYCYIHTLPVNKKRNRRSQGKTHKSTLPLWNRVSNVLIYGKLSDYTSPSEIDPYWKILYDTYEFLSYVKVLIVYKTLLSDEIISDEELELNLYIIKNITKYQKNLTLYIMNFMQLIYGNVLKTKFYGWTKYHMDMVSKFKEISLINIHNLKFDSNRSKSSVYFYQVFWLSGIVYTRGISADIKLMYEEEHNNDRGNIIFSDDEEDSVYFINTEPVGILEFKPVNNNTSNFSENGVDDDTLNDTSNDVVYSETINYDEISDDRIFDLENDKSIDVETIVINILKKLNISKDWLYDATDREIKNLGKKIKRYINAKKISFTVKEMTILNNILNKKHNI